MSDRQNCWEFKNCGREQEGDKVSELGVCPAAEDIECEGLNSGNYGGRICWAVAGTFCGGKLQGMFAQKLHNCMGCDFFKIVKEEQGVANFKLMKPGQKFKIYQD